MEWEKTSRRKWAEAKGINRAEMDWKKRIPGKEKYEGYQITMSKYGPSFEESL